MNEQSSTCVHVSLVPSLIPSFYRLQYKFAKSWGRPGNEAMCMYMNDASTFAHFMYCPRNVMVSTNVIDKPLFRDLEISMSLVSTLWQSMAQNVPAPLALWIRKG